MSEPVCEVCGEAVATTVLPAGRDESGAVWDRPRSVCRLCFRWLDPNMSDADRLRRRKELEAYESALNDRAQAALDALDRAIGGGAPEVS